MKSEVENILAHINKLEERKEVIEHAVDYEIKMLRVVAQRIRHVKDILKKARRGDTLTEQEQRIWDKIQKYSKQKKEMIQASRKSKSRKLRLLEKLEKLKKKALLCVNN